MEATDAHLVDDERRRERRVAIAEVERNRLAVVRLEIALAGIVHEYVLLSLSAAQLCFALLRNNSPTSLCAACWTHPGFEAYEELISIEFFLMIWAHEQAVAGLVGGVVFRLLGDPVSALELRPLVALRQL